MNRAGVRAAALGLLLCVLLPVCARAGELPQPTMTPLEAGEEVPEQIAQMIRVAQAEVVALDKRALPRSNKYSIWYYNDQRRIGWCSCFISWCANEAGLPLLKKADAEPMPGDAVFVTNEASVFNTYTAYEAAGRITDIPRPGYHIVYGVIGSTPYTHVGLVESVKDLGNGVYELTTLEGNVSNTCKRYSFYYILNPERPHRNFVPIPAELQIRDDAQYKLHKDNWCITGFGASWLPRGE
ncbi:MAG: CHAP domain-containing protein [Clostridia bacterium]|nr:CHAP domain-containing protein [Clostridia bacterium]